MKNLVITVWALGWGYGLAYVHYVAYRNPDRHRVTAWLNRVWSTRLAHGSVGLLPFRKASSVLLFEAIFLFCLTTGLAILFLLEDLA